MVKLDLEINELVGLGELGKIDKKKLKKFLKAASKDELEDYIIDNTFENEGEQDADSTDEGEETVDDNDL